MNPYTAHFVEGFDAVYRLGLRLISIKEKLKDHFPLDTKIINDEDTEILVDAFLKRFDNIQDLLSRQVFRNLLVLEEVDVREMSPRDITIAMEKHEIVASDADWQRIRNLRNALAHEYPRHIEWRIKRLNEAFAMIDPLIAVVDALRAYVMRKELADLSAYPPLTNR